MLFEDDELGGALAVGLFDPDEVLTRRAHFVERPL